MQVKMVISNDAKMPSVAVWWSEDQNTLEELAEAIQILSKAKTWLKRELDKKARRCKPKS
jgi:hypothetical protein